MPLNHRHTTDHGQVTFIFSCVSLFRCFSSAIRILEVVDDHADGMKQSKLSGGFKDYLFTPCGNDPICHLTNMFQTFSNGLKAPTSNG